MVVGAYQSCQFLKQNTWFLKNNKVLPKFLHGILNLIIMIITIIIIIIIIIIIVIIKIIIKSDHKKNIFIYTVSHLDLLVKRKNIK